MENLNKGVFQKMTQKEKEDLCFLRLAGLHQYDEEGNLTVMMGSQSFQRVLDKEKEMNEKYGTK